MAQNPPPELNKNDPDSLYNWVAYKVSCPHFRNPIKNFIDENCSTFVDIDENSFEQGQLFNEMNLLIENLLKDVLEEGQITQEDFLKAAERGIEDKKYKKYFNQIINFGNYPFFKSIMTKRNYQIIQMAEKEMNQEKEKEKRILNEDQNPNNEGNTGLTPEIYAQMLENEQSEINEAIKQSLADEDEKRRIAIIEEEEMRRAIKQSLEQSKKEQKEIQKNDKKKEESKKEETKKEEPKKEIPKKEEPKKEESKKFVPNIISNNTNFTFSGKEENKQNPTVISSNKGFQLEVSSKTEEFGVINQSKGEIHDSFAAPIQPNQTKKEEKLEKKSENIIKNQEKLINETKKEENKNTINEPKKEERITRDFVNIFEEKKLTLAPLVHKSYMQNPKNITLKEDLQKNQKTNVQKDIEKMKKKSEEKNESAKDVIKNSLRQSSMNKNDINNIEDGGGLLIDDDEEDEVKQTDNKVSKNKIHFERIAIPKNFNDKIPDYNKEKQEQLKEYREKILKIKKDEREQKANNQ